MEQAKTGTEDARLEQQKRLVAAKENYDKLKETIAPYIVRRRFVMRTTTGKWCEGDQAISGTGCRE